MITGDEQATNPEEQCQFTLRESYDLVVFCALRVGHNRPHTTHSGETRGMWTLEKANRCSHCGHYGTPQRLAREEQK